MSLEVLISLKAKVRLLFHHGFEQLHIRHLGMDFSAVHSMQPLMNHTALSSSSGLHEFDPC